VDGEAVSARIERELRTVVGSTAGMRRAAAVEAALRTERDPCVVEFEDVEGKALRVSVPTKATPPAALHVARSLSLSWPEEGVALISLPSFAVLDWAAWLKTPVEERDAFLEKDKAALDAVFDKALEAKPRAVILDLRGNGGGTDLLGIHAAQRLVGRRFRYFQLSAKYSGAWSPPHGQWHSPRKPTLEAPLFVLIDEGVFSTADNFARCLDEMRPDAVFIGRPTGAGTGAPAVIATLPHSGAVVSACTQRVYGPVQTLIEGVGTTPDIPVVWTVEDGAQGRDPDLAAALARIGGKAPAGSP
jgi:C-terminal processing protease CtpA/Prc